MHMPGAPTAPNNASTWMSLADFVETPVGRQLPPFVAIREQLPDGIARRVSLKIDRDPYELMVWADFTSKDGRHFCTQVDAHTYRLGDVFISRICLVL